MEKWIPRCGREAQSGQGHGATPPAAWALSTLTLGSGTGGCVACVSCPKGFWAAVLPAGPRVCDPPVTPESSLGPGALTSPIFCTRLSVVHPEYVVLSTAGSRYGGELQMRRQTRCVWPLPGTRKGRGTGGNRGPTKGLRPGASGGAGTPPHGHEEKQPVYRWGHRASLCPRRQEEDPPPFPMRTPRLGASQGMPLNSQPQLPSVRRGEGGLPTGDTDTRTSRGTHICSRIFLKSSNSCRAVLRPSAMRLQLSPPPPMNLQEARLSAPRAAPPTSRGPQPQGATSRPLDHT